MGVITAKDALSDKTPILDPSPRGKESVIVVILNAA